MKHFSTKYLLEILKNKAISFFYLAFSFAFNFMYAFIGRKAFFTTILTDFLREFSNSKENLAPVRVRASIDVNFIKKVYYK